MIDSRPCPRPTPPTAERRPHDVERFGERLEDPWFWLREKTTRPYSPTSRPRSVHRGGDGARRGAPGDALPGDARPDQADRPRRARYREGDYLYYTRTEEGKQYPIHCRQEGQPRGARGGDARPQRAGQGAEVLGLGELRRSATTATCSRTRPTHRLPRVHAARQGPADRQAAAGHGSSRSSVAWAADNETLFYVTEDAAKRRYQLYRHALGERASDALIYEEKDELFGVERRPVARAASTCSCSAGSHDHVRGALLARRPAGRARSQVILPREDGHEYYVDHRAGRSTSAPTTRPELPPGDRAGRTTAPANWKE